MAFDMHDYLCPTAGITYLLSSSESCRSVICADGWINFCKNRHKEEFRVDENYIYRGSDTSLISSDGVNPVGTFYTQYDGDNYGAIWCPRYMLLGETVERHCRVVVRDYLCNILNDYSESSPLTFVDHFDRIEFPGGLIVSDIIQLRWSGEEGYLYANQLGLVGWRNIVSGQFGNYVVALNVSTPAPPFEQCLTRPFIG